MRTAWFGTAGLCLLVVGGTLGIEAVETRAAIRLSLTTAGLDVRSIAVDPLAGTVTLEGLEGGGPSAHLSIGRLTLDTGAAIRFVTAAQAAPAKPEPPQPPARPSLSPPAPVIGDAVADNVVVTSGPATYRAAHVELKGTPLSNADLAALLDARSGDGLEARLRKLTAASVSVPELTGSWTVGGAEQRASVHDIVLADVVAGRAATGAASGVTLATTMGADATNVGITAVAAKGLDLAQLAHATESVRANDDEASRPVLDSLDLRGATFLDVTRKHGVSAETITLKGVSLRPLKTRLGDSLALVAGSDLRSPQVQAVEADLAASMAVDAADISTIAARDVPAPNEAATNSDNSSGTIGGVSFAALGHGRLGSASIRDVSLQGGGSTIGLASFDAKSIILNVPRSAAGPATPVTPLVGAFELKQLTLASRGDAADASKLPTHLKLAGASFDSDGLMPDAVPTRATLAIEHLTFDASPDDDATKMLALMGYKEVDLSGTIASRYDAAQQTLSIDRLSLAGAGMGDVALTLDLANVSKGIASSQPEVQKASALAMLLKGLVLDIRNTGFFQRALETKARMDGTDVAAEKAQDVNFVTLMLPALVNNNPKVKLIGDAIGRFITSPTTLHLSIMSKSGLGFADLAAMINDPSALFDQLDVQATADGTPSK